MILSLLGSGRRLPPNSFLPVYLFLLSWVLPLCGVISTESLIVHCRLCSPPSARSTTQARQELPTCLASPRLASSPPPSIHSSLPWPPNSNRAISYIPTPLLSHLPFLPVTRLLPAPSFNWQPWQMVALVRPKPVIPPTTMMRNPVLPRRKRNKTTSPPVSFSPPPLYIRSFGGRSPCDV